MNAQLVSTEELNSIKTRLFGNQNWKSIANNINSHSILDANNSISYTKVIETPGITKEQLFDTMKEWATEKFYNPDGGIQLVEKDKCLMTIKASQRDVIKSYIYGGDEYTISLYLIIKIQTKDGRAKVTVTIPSYNVHRHDYSSNIDKEELWPVSICYPFVPSVLDSHSQTSAKALVMSHVCATKYIEIIEEAMHNYKTTPIEENNW